MATYDRYGASRKKKSRSVMFAPLIFLVAVLALAFFAGIFFRVQNIEVIGASYYSHEEIVEASGVETGDNLFFINRFSASSNIFSRLPFVDAASMERQFPSTIVITVTESRAVAYVDWQGQSWMLTSTGKLLGSGSNEQLQGLVHVKNLTPLNPVVGEAIAVEEGESLKLSCFLSVIAALERNGLIGSISELDMLNPVNPQLRYAERFTVKLGTDTDLDYKLRMMLAAAAQLDPTETALLDVSDGATVYVSPD